MTEEELENLAHYPHRCDIPTDLDLYEETTKVYKIWIDLGYAPPEPLANRVINERKL